MMTKVQKWGNSQGLRLSKSTLADAQLSVGDEVDVVVREGVIVIKPETKIRGKYKLKDLVSRIPRTYRAEESDFGPPVGGEVW
jgi:antitoxin MazE